MQFSITFYSFWIATLFILFSKSSRWPKSLSTRRCTAWKPTSSTQKQRKSICQTLYSRWYVHTYKHSQLTRQKIRVSMFSIDPQQTVHHKLKLAYLDLDINIIAPLSNFSRFMQPKWVHNSTILIINNSLIEADQARMHIFLMLEELNHKTKDEISRTVTSPCPFIN